MHEIRQGTRFSLAAFILALALLACGGGGSGGTTSSTSSGPPPNPGPLVFKASPIDPASIRWITPLGNLNPPAHPLPTDHIYFYFANPNTGESPVLRRTAFMAPADGTVTDIFHNDLASPDVKLFIRATDTVTYYIDHLIPDAPITVGTKLTAGQRLGTTGSVFAVDLGVVNSSLTLAFLNPSRYVNGDSLHADAPLKYYEEPLRAQLYGLVQRLGSEKDGRIDYDVAGRLAGNWFVEFGTAPLLFVYDTYDPTRVLISVPGFASVPGVFSIAVTDPAPKDVSVATGPVRYLLTPAQTGSPFTADPVGRLLVQVLDAGRIKAETFPLSDPAVAFTSAAHQFLR